MSPKRLQAASLFGLTLSRRGRLVAPVRSTARLHRARAARLISCLPRGSILILTGPSGAGKSTLLRALAHHARTQHLRTLHPPRPTHGSRILIDSIPGPLPHALRTLALVGLAEGPLLLRPLNTLSGGERWRAALASMLAQLTLRPPHTHSRQPTLLLIDEFASTLDPASTHAAFNALRHAARVVPIRIILATPRPLTDLVPCSSDPPLPQTSSPSNHCTTPQPRPVPSPAPSALSTPTPIPPANPPRRSSSLTRPSTTATALSPGPSTLAAHWLPPRVPTSSTTSFAPSPALSSPPNTAPKASPSISFARISPPHSHHSQSASPPWATPRPSSNAQA